MTTEYERIKQEVERTRLALNAVPWWRFIKRQEAADDYKHALYVGALWELRNGTNEESS